MYGNIDRIQEAVSPILMRLLEGTKEKKNYIFGTGWMGTKFWDVCTKMNFQFDGFIVTRKTSSTYHGIPVYSLDECTYIMKHATVFVTLRDQEPALLQKLAELFSVVVPITYPRDLTLVEAKFFIDYLKKLGVSCCQDWIMMNGYRFPNPFLKPDDYLLSWAYEAGDLLLPALYDDEVRVDEGPYELGMVALSDGDVVIDAGANIGLFTCYALQKNCRVYAFEPLKLAIEYLQEIQSEFKQRLTICPSALAEKNSTAVFHVQNYDLLGASLHYNHNSVDHGIMMINSHNIKRKAFRDNFFPDKSFWTELGIEKDEDIQYMYAGIKLLKHHIDEYGDLKKALMVYNGGPKVFRKADADLKEKTSAYAEKVFYNLDLLKTDFLNYKAERGLIPVYSGYRYTISAANN